MRARGVHGLVVGAALLLVPGATPPAAASNVVLRLRARVTDASGAACAGLPLVASGEHAAHGVNTDRTGRCVMTLSLGERALLERAPRIVTLRSGSPRVHLVGRDSPEIALAIGIPALDRNTLDLTTSDGRIRLAAPFRRPGGDTAEAAIELRCAPGPGAAERPPGPPPEGGAGLGPRIGSIGTLHEAPVARSGSAPEPVGVDTHPGPSPPVRVPAGPPRARVGGSEEIENRHGEPHCACRIEGTVELAGRPARGRVGVAVRIAGTPIADTLDVRAGAARGFVLESVPCGARRLEVSPVSRTPRLVVRGAGSMTCTGATLRPRIILRLRDPRAARD